MLRSSGKEKWGKNQLVYRRGCGKLGQTIILAVLVRQQFPFQAYVYFSELHLS
jgi:hypothetical protein